MQAVAPEGSSEAHRNAMFSLLLPGKVLHLNALLLMRKFRDRGNKGGAVRGFETLEKHGLGHLISTRLQRGANMVTTNDLHYNNLNSAILAGSVAQLVKPLFRVQKVVGSSPT